MCPLEKRTQAGSAGARSEWGGGPLCDGTSAWGGPWGRTLTGYYKFWAPRRQQSPLLNFYLLAGFSEGAKAQKLTGRAPYRTLESLVQKPVVLRPPGPLGAQGATSCPEAGGAVGGWAPVGQFMN